jgi:hypothetical protein
VKDPDLDFTIKITAGAVTATTTSCDGQTQRRCGHAGKETLGQ